jgi:pimeloyl-ACP methyl ester carboxylesterase
VLIANWPLMIDNYEHAFIQTNGVRLHVIMAGDPQGKSVLLLHGFPEFWFGWRHQIPALVAAGFRVVVPDQRGYNLSDKPRGVHSYRTAILVQDVIGLLDQLKIVKVDLAGHDWGAAVAWGVAIGHPNRIARLAILNMPHPVVMLHTLRTSPAQLLKSWYIGFFQIPGLADWILRLNHCAATSRMLALSGNNNTFTTSDLVEYKKAWEQPGALTAMINWYRAIFWARPVYPANVRVHVPTLILWGKRDVALSSQMALRSLELCDDGRLVFYENATHWVQHDEAEEVDRQLISFFM